MDQLLLVLILQVAHLTLTVARKLYKSKCFLCGCCGWKLKFVRTASDNNSSDDSPPEPSVPRHLHVDIPPENTPLNGSFHDESSMYRAL